MEKGDGIGSEAAALGNSADTALPAGPLATNNVEGDSGRLPASSETQPGTAMGGRGTRGKESRLSTTRGGGRPLAARACEMISKEAAEMRKRAQQFQDMKELAEGLIREEQRMMELTHDEDYHLNEDQVKLFIEKWRRKTPTTGPELTDKVFKEVLAGVVSKSEQSSEDPGEKSREDSGGETLQSQPQSSPASQNTEPEAGEPNKQLDKLCVLLEGAVREHREEDIRSYHHGVLSALQRMERLADVAKKDAET